MSIWFRLKVSAMRKLLFLVFILLLTSCGSNSLSKAAANHTSTQTPDQLTKPSPTQTSGFSPTPATVGTLNKAPIFANIHGLHIQSTDGLQCPLRKFPLVFQGNAGLVDAPSDALVLSENRLSYSADEIQQIKNYINEIFHNIDSIATSYQVPPPPMLLWVPGSRTCSITWQVSNIGNSSIQVGSLGVRLTSTPQFNAYQYRPIDVCYITGALCGPLSAGGDCSAYSASIILNPHATTDALFAAKPQPGNTMVGSCPALPTLFPGDTLYFHIDLTSMASQQSSIASYIFHVVPTITLIDAIGEHLFTLSSMAGSVAFIDESQLSCYGLMNQEHDTTFVPIDWQNSVNSPIGCLS